MLIDTVVIIYYKESCRRDELRGAASTQLAMLAMVCKFMLPPNGMLIGHETVPP